MNKKFIMSKGQFLDKEHNETVSSIRGTLAGIRTLTPEDGAMKLQLDLKDESNEEPVINTLTLGLYADPALKILRCLYGIAEIISGKVITISLEEREGRGALISVYADDEALPACGAVEAYAYDKKLFTDKTFGILKRCLEFSRPVLVYANADGVYPANDEGDTDVEAVCSYIREMRRLGRSGELTVKKNNFTIPAAAKGYIKALNDLRNTCAFRFFDDEESVDAIWAAFTEELPAEPNAETGAVAVGDEEEV